MTATDASSSFDLGRVASETFGLVGRNFAPFFVAALIFSGAPAVAVLVLQPMLMQPGTQPGLDNVLGMLTVVLITIAAAYALLGALTRASVDDLSGKGVSINGAIAAGLQNLLPLIGLAILVGLGVVAGAILLIVPGIMLAMRWFVSAPALVVERKGVFESMARSNLLTKGHRWPIFGLLVIYIIAAIIITAIVNMVFLGAMTVDPAAAMASGGFGALGIVFMIVTIVIQALESMISTVGVAVIYFELRRIKEGVGVAELAAVFE